MDNGRLPSYAVFDDYRYTQRVAVLVRWFVIVVWLFLHNYRLDLEPAYFINSGLVLTVAVVNAYVHWRIIKGRPVTRRYVLALGFMDLSFITAGIIATSRFDNTFFPLYYPALVGFAIVASSRTMSFITATGVVIAYSMVSIFMDPGVDFSAKEERVLIIRAVCMYAVVGATHLMWRIETNRRREAVEAERVQAARNLELQRQAQQAELVAQEERHRISREIHDGIAQAIYMISLHLETCADLARRGAEDLTQRLDGLVSLSKEALLEIRHYIFDLKPYMAGEKGVVEMVQNQIREFDKVAGVSTEVETSGPERPVSVPVATCLYRVTQEALVNVLKHSNASSLQVGVMFTSDGVALTVTDDGSGFDPGDSSNGHGLANMRHRAEELGGEFRLDSRIGIGTTVTVQVPDRTE